MNSETYEVYEQCLENAEVFGDVLQLWEDSTGTLEEGRLKEMLENNVYLWLYLDSVQWLLLARELSLHLEVNGF